MMSSPHFWAVTILFQNCVKTYTMQKHDVVWGKSDCSFLCEILNFDKNFSAENSRKILEKFWPQWRHCSYREFRLTMIESDCHNPSLLLFLIQIPYKLLFFFQFLNRVVVWHNRNLSVKITKWFEFYQNIFMNLIFCCDCRKCRHKTKMHWNNPAVKKHKKI